MTCSLMLGLRTRLQGAGAWGKSLTHPHLFQKDREKLPEPLRVAEGIEKAEFSPGQGMSFQMSVCVCVNKCIHI